MNKFLQFSILALLISLPFAASAHTGLKTSVPADGATIAEAPDAINLEFTAAVRLIRLEVSRGENKLDIGFKPTAENKANYSIATAALGTGQYTVEWAVIGADGHTVTNSFSFSVDPSVAGSAP